MFAVLLVGCGEADLQGIVIETTENYLLIAQNLSADEYEKIRHKSPTDIQNDDVAGIGSHLNLIDISYDRTADFSPGDFVQVWLSGDIMTSYPAQATAKKIEHRK